MEAQEAADKIRETTEKAEHADELFRRRAAVIIGVLAMILAITALSTESASRDVLAANIQSSDTYAFYQAKNIRQTDTQLAADQLTALLLTQPALSGSARAAVQKQIDADRAAVAHLESDPAAGNGKQQLLAQAQALDAHRAHTEKQLPNFEIAQGLLQIGIVLGSVSIVAAARWLLWTGIGLGAVALALLVNGHLLLAELPIG
ncbi:MAG TPA: DUF4337 family protein [Chloroflexota bacterium]|jgi:hypothetical protein|nr:DUF4337 family protein [Chloroflexota bacterium]